MKFVSNSEKDTLKFAENFAKTLHSGDVILLKGDLGAGKTVFVKGLALALSSGKELAISPTFTIINEYNTSPKLYHFDFYRINSEDELLAIGIEEYLYGNGICAIEWPERAPQLLAGVNAYLLEIKKDGNKRIIIVDKK